MVCEAIQNYFGRGLDAGWLVGLLGLMLVNQLGAKFTSCTS
jgi:hypothetical protein